MLEMTIVESMVFFNMGDGDLPLHRQMTRATTAPKARLVG
jgi:hypothetical protein